MNPMQTLHSTYSHVRGEPWSEKLGFPPGRRVIILGESQSTWRACRGYVEDIARGIVLAVENPDAAGRVYNVAAEEALTEREWVRAIADIVGWTGKIVQAARHRQG